MIDGLDHVHIMCVDLEKAVRYFEDLFGGKVESRTELQGSSMVRMYVQGIHVTRIRFVNAPSLAHTLRGGVGGAMARNPGSAALNALGPAPLRALTQ